MSLQMRLKELERKHKALDEAIHNAMTRPSSTDADLAEMKRRKLQLKDDIEKVRAGIGSKTVH
ncbi:MAG: YdcH family protein [Bosea sp. (in: a-proteobacteria)]